MFRLASGLPAARVVLRSLLSAALLLSATAARSQQANSACIDLGPAKSYDAFVAGDYQGWNSDIEGSLAVGGSAWLWSYSVGASLPQPPVPLALSVGGDLLLDSTGLFGSVALGGSLSAGGATLGGPVNPPAAIDAAAAESALLSASTALAALPANGTTAFEWGGIFLTGADAKLNIFTIQDWQTQSTWGYEVSVPPGSSVLVNVVGPWPKLWYAGIDLPGVAPEQVLWNIPDTTWMPIEGVGVIGSVLAPNAQLGFNNGVIEGQFFANSFYGDGQTNLHRLAACFPGTQTAAPASLALALSAPASVQPGDALAYTLTATDTGSTDIAAASGTVTLPDGSSEPFSFAGIAPGASATTTLSWKESLSTPRGGMESSADYLARLQALNGSSLLASTQSSWTDAEGTSGTAHASASTQLELPIYQVSLLGDGLVDPGALVHDTLSISNVGGVTAASASLTVTLPDQTLRTLTLDPSVLTAGGTQTFTLSAPIAVGHAAGALLATASANWTDVHGGKYGAVDASARTIVDGVNAAPVVKAGADQQVSLAAGADLQGVVTDDGLPMGSVLQSQWAVIDGPGSVLFASAITPATHASFSLVGNYSLELSATDGALSSNAKVNVTVTTDGLAPKLPTVDAGPDQSVLVLQATLAGSVTPAVAGQTLETVWIKTAGPSNATFADATDLHSQVTFSTPGTYTLRLVASDGSFSAHDDVNIVTQRPNLPPTVTATVERVVSERRQILVDGSAEDPTASQANPIPGWTQVSGQWFATSVNNPSGYAPFDGKYFFWPGSVVGGEMYQDIDVRFEEPGTMFQFIGYTEAWNQSPSDASRFIIEYRDASGDVLDSFDSQEISSVDIWHYTTDERPEPPGTTTIRVRLLAHRYDGFNDDSYFDGMSLIAEPNLTTTLTGVVTDDGEPAGAAITQQWTQVSGPGTAFFEHANQKVTRVTFSTAGTYVLRLTASDTLATSSADVSLNVVQDPPNTRPVVNAGGPQTITLPDATVALHGVVTDDGLPSGGHLSYTWSKVSGPAAVVFTPVGSLDTVGRFFLAGTYVIALAANDGQLTSSAQVTVTVIPPDLTGGSIALEEQYPQSFLAGTPRTLLATVRDGSGTLVPAQPVSATITGPNAGTISYFTDPTGVAVLEYVGQAVGTDVVQATAVSGPVTLVSNPIDVVWSSSPNNQPPTISINVPSTATVATAVGLSATAHDDGLPSGSLATLWSQTSGPGTATFSAPAQLATNVTFSQPGTYVVRFTASDSELGTYSEALVSVSGSIQNQPPKVNAGFNQALPTGTLVAQLSGAASDDGLPRNSLTTTWTQVSGPSPSTIATPTSLFTSVVFTTPGTYVFQLSANDTQYTATAQVIIVLGTPQNLAPIVSAGAAQQLPYPQNVATLDGTVSDDGLPFGGTLTQQWGQASGPGQVVFSAPDQLATQAQFPVPGTYVLRLTASDTELSSSATVSIVAGSASQLLGPMVDPGPDQTLSLPNTTALLAGTVSEPTLPAGATVTSKWSQVSGPLATIVSSSNPTTEVLLTTAGVYQFSLQASDGHAVAVATTNVVLNPTAQGAQLVANPGPDLTLALPPGSADLHGHITVGGVPADGSFPVEWSQLAGPGTVTFSDETSLSPTATFPVTGSYVLQLAAGTAPNLATGVLGVTVIGTTPVITVDAGSDQALASFTLPAPLSGTASISNAPMGTVLSTQWTLVSGPGQVDFANASALQTNATFNWPGFYTLRLTAGEGSYSASSDMHVAISSPAGDLPTVAITSPDDGSHLTLPTQIKGSVSNGLWKLELAHDGDDSADQTWTQIAQGSGTVTNGVLGTFDPTLRINGTYSIRLTGSTDAGDISTAISVVADKGVKVGIFNVAFNDMTLPLPGLPLTITRSYSSADDRMGAFGAGWQLSLGDVRVEKSVILGKFWEEVADGSFEFPTYCLQTTRPNIVTITFPTGKVYQFQATVSPACQQLQPIDTPDLSFTPMPGTLGSLTVAGSEPTTFVNLENGIPGFVQLFDTDGQSIYNPTEFVLTTAEGYSYDLKQDAGVLSVTDRNGNSLVLNPNGIASSTGLGVAFIRDAQGRITQITDPNGASLGYSYDAEGNLQSFTDRAGNVTNFGYDDSHGLVRITDARGIDVLGNTYDADGRLAATADADQNQITFTHDLGGHREQVTDRLGYTTTYLYDDDGNVVSLTDPLGNTTLDTFDENDNKLSETDALGHTTTWTYDGAFDMLTQVDPLGNKTAWTYDQYRQVLTTTDPLGHTTTNLREEVAVCGNATPTGNLLATTDPLGNTTQFTYNCDGTVATQTDARGAVTAYAYDGAGHIVSMTDALGHVTSRSYDANGNQLSETKTRTKPDGTLETLITAYIYDANNHRTQVTYADGSTTRTTFNSIGMVSDSYDQLNRHMQYAYDDQGRSTTTNYPDGTSSGVSYDADGRLGASTDRGGRMTAYGYDAVGRMTSTTFADGASRETGYDPVGRATSSTDELGHVTSLAYDDAGRRTEVVDALNEATLLAYDKAGNQTTVTDSLGHAVTRFYDASNRVISTVYADGTHDDIGYDQDGDRISKTDQAGVVMHYSYDLLGRLVAVTDALNQVTSYAYDEPGNRISQTDANGHTTSFEYDSLGRRTARVLPMGQRELTTYFADGQFASRTDFNGRTTTYTYDSASRLTTRTPDAYFLSQGEPAVTWTYYQTGRRHTMSDESGTTYYAYDPRDRLLSKSSPEGALSYTYDAAGNQRTVLTDSGTYAVGYDYDVLNRLASVADKHPDALATTGGMGQITHYHYDLAGRVSDYEYPNGVETTLTYDDLNRVTGITAMSGSTALLSYTYSFLPTGNRHSVTELSGRNVAWEYDGLYRLINETIAGAASVNGSIGYVYDAVGNRLSRSSTVSGIAAQSTGYDADDRLTSDGWDAEGNTLSRATNAYVYDSQNRLTGFDSGAARYIYDGDGQLVAKSTGGATVTYLVDDQTPTGYTQIAEERASGSVETTYIYGLDRISARGSGAVYWFAYDAHSGVRALLDASGAITDSYEYDAFGNVAAHAGTTDNGFTYRGEWSGAGNGNIYLRARWLDPNIARFGSRDTNEGDLQNPLTRHAYGYGGNDPVGNRDPSGHDFDIASISAALGSVGILASTAGVRAVTLVQGVYLNLYLIPGLIDRVTAVLTVADFGLRAADEVLIRLATNVYHADVGYSPGPGPRGLQVGQAAQQNLGDGFKGLDHYEPTTNVGIQIKSTTQVATAAQFLAKVRSDAQNLRALRGVLSGRTASGNPLAIDTKGLNLGLLEVIPADAELGLQEIQAGLQEITASEEIAIYVQPVFGLRGN